MKKFVKEYIKFKGIWEEENMSEYSSADLNDDIVLKAFEIYKNQARDKKDSSNISVVSNSIENPYKPNDIKLNINQARDKR